MELRGKKVLVTGADGFIGSHLAEKLVADGCSVRAFVCYNSFNSYGWLDFAPEKIRNSMEIFQGDIRDAYRVKKAMEGCHAVFHLAALIAIPYSYQTPESYVETNVNGTLNVLQASRELGTERIIHTSSSEVYGTAQQIPISETHPLHPQSPYAASKVGADQLALSFFRSFTTPVSIVRPFNTYGPRQSNRAVIPTIITQIASGGRNLKLDSLTHTRDFSFAADTVRGFLKTARCDAAVGEVVNIGSGFEVSISEAVETIAQIMGVQVEAQVVPDRLRSEKSEVLRLLADTSKAEALFGWKPEFGGKDGFRRGLQETVKWFTDPENLKHYKMGRYAL